MYMYVIGCWAWGIHGFYGGIDSTYRLASILSIPEAKLY